MFAVIIIELNFFVNFKALNGDFYKNTLNKSDYFSLMRKDIDFGFRNLSMITSLPEEIFISSVSDGDILHLAYENLNSAEDYMKYNTKYIDNKIDTKIIYDNLQTYAQKHNIKVDDNLKNELLAVSEDAGNIINNHAILFNINEVDKYPQFQTLKRLIHLLSIITILPFAAVFLLIILLLLLNRKTPIKMFLWTGSSLIPAAIMTLIPCILALFYNTPNRFPVDNAYLKVALSDISLGYIKCFTITGVIVLLVGICCMYIYTHLNNKCHNK
jgi:hypothetical protein